MKILTKLHVNLRRNSQAYEYFNVGSTINIEYIEVKFIELFTYFSSPNILCFILKVLHI